tara:strand:- start:1042 stop:1608 length:567 start_codon:yes stop_codon:yes gene_type:complete
MSEQNENTPIVDDNNEKNDNTKVETNVENMIPQSRVNEITAKFHKANDELQQLKESQEAQRKKELEKQGEYKTLLEEQGKELDKYKADSNAWNEYKANKRESIMGTITNDEDKQIAKDLSLEKLEMFANRVTQTNTIGTPNQRPANSAKGTGEFGGYSSMEEWAIKDPKGCDEHLTNNVQGYQWGKVK